MKRFLNKLTGLYLIFFTFTIAVTIAMFSIVNLKSDFKISDKSKYVVFGHSHPECAYNDSLIFNFKNLAASGESYFYTYQKIKKTISQNPQIEVVFIEFTTNNFNKSKDSEICDEVIMSERYPIYSPFMDLNDHLILISNNTLGFFNTFSISMKKQMTRIVRDDYSYKDLIGGYKYLVRDKIDSLLKIEDKSITLNKVGNTGISFYNLHYLEKIVKFCNENNTKVYLLRSPYHKKYHGNRYEQKLQEIKKQKFPETDFLDFKDFPIKNSEFGDLNHLNYRGSEVFSIWFDKLLKDDLLEKKDKTSYINKMINNETVSIRIENY